MTAAAATTTVSTVRHRPAWAIPAIAVGLVVAYFLVLTFVLSLNPQTSAAAPQIAIQQVANALSIGAIYALIALGEITFDANGDTSQKINTIYKVDPAGAGGKGAWVADKEMLAK